MKISMPVLVLTMLHSLMESNVSHAISLNSGIPELSLVHPAHSVNTSTQLQANVSHVQLVSFLILLDMSAIKTQNARLMDKFSIPQLMSVNAQAIIPI